MRRILLCCWLYAAGNPTMAAAQTLLPTPRSIQPATGTFTLDSTTVLLYASPAEKRIATLFHDYLKERYALDLPLQQGAAGDEERSGVSIVFSGTGSPAGPEAYHISILPRKITVTGKDAGIFYGLQTLLQLFPGHVLSLSCKEIDDAPAFGYRGIMLDVGLHFFPVAFIRQCIDLMAQYKLNIFHWHLTEDQGWRIEIKKYPRLTSVGSWRAQTVIGHPDRPFDGFDHTPYGGYYSQAEVREIVQYAAERYVTIIPEIEMPGHCRSALTAYPYLACNDHPGPFTVAETWGIFDDVYCPGKESTFAFLEDVLSEVMDLFPGKYIHIGGDECPKTKWKQCPYCQQRIRDLHLKDENELQSYFIRRIEKFIRSRSRQLIGWDEILEGGLAPNATVMSWRGTAGGTAAARLGHDVVMAPNTALYFDYGQGDPAQEPRTIDGYNPLPKVYAYDPIPKDLSPEQQAHIKGVEACLWTEYVPTPAKATYMLMPRMLALAETGWTPAAQKNKADFLTKRLPVLLGRLDRTGMIYRVPEPIGVTDTTLYGAAFHLSIQPSVAGATVFYTLDGHAPRETDAGCDQPLDILVAPGEKRMLKTVVITPSGKRSAVVTTLLRNDRPEAAQGGSTTVRHTGSTEYLTSTSGTLFARPTEYLTGTGSAPIDPDSTLFSLALAGYGLPREGRFSITWKYTSDVPGLHFPSLLSPDSAPITCTDLGQTDTLLGYCRQGQTFYGISTHNVLWKGVQATKDRQWRRIGRYNGGTYAITVKRLAILHRRLYAQDADGKIYRAEHASDSTLSARCLAIRHKNKTALILGLDLTGIDHSFARRIKAEVQRRWHIPPSAVLINLSHTHFAPVTQAWSTWAEFLQTPDSGYLYRIVEKGILRSISLALSNMTPSRLYFGRGITHIGHNRSSNDKQTPYDSTLDVLKVTDLRDRIKNILFLTGCHPVFREKEDSTYFILSANYPGMAKKAIEVQTGTQHALFIQGCAGDINPVDLDPAITGRRLAEDVQQVLQRPMQCLQGGISWSFDSVILPLHPWSEEKVRQYREENARHPGNIFAEKNVRWADLMLQHYRSNAVSDRWPVYVQTLNIGDWRLVGLSREVVTEYGMAIRALWPGQRVSVAGYTNAVPSYLPNRWHIEAGTYEGGESFFWYGQPAIPEKDLFEKIIQKINGK